MHPHPWQPTPPGRKVKRKFGCVFHRYFALFTFVSPQPSVGFYMEKLNFADRKDVRVRSRSRTHFAFYIIYTNVCIKCENAVASHRVFASVYIDIYRCFHVTALAVMLHIKIFKMKMWSRCIRRLRRWWWWRWKRQPHTTFININKQI